MPEVTDPNDRILNFVCLHIDDLQLNGSACWHIADGVAKDVAYSHSKQFRVSIDVTL